MSESVEDLVEDDDYDESLGQSSVDEVIVDDEPFLARFTKSFVPEICADCRVDNADVADIAVHVAVDASCTPIELDSKLGKKIVAAVRKQQGHGIGQCDDCKQLASILEGPAIL